MRPTAGTLVLIGALTLVSVLAPGRVAAAGVIILVETTSDAEFPADGKCSLRAAIAASNVGGFAGYCQGSSGQDSIRFNLGSGVPVITLGSALPEIVQPVTIRGNTGGATRVSLSGGGLLVRIPADGSYIGGMVLGGLQVHGADNVKVVGSVLGSINGTSAGNLTIGGSNPRTPDPCSGDCNLISGGTGIYLTGANGTIAGNFIGVDATGEAAAANGVGIRISSGAGLTIGGTTPDTRNIISGNTRVGIDLHGCTGCVIEGNHIGTNAAGNAAIPNGTSGISLSHSEATVGGSIPGAGNVISGNAKHGIVSDFADAGSHAQITILGNRIGTKAGGGALGNGGDGIHLTAAGLGAKVVGAVIGSVDTDRAANVIAYNGGAGVHIDDSYSKYDAIRGNSIHHNGGPGIELVRGANESIAAPAISGMPIAGTACANCVVDIYSDSADEGRYYEGAVTADGAGDWTFSGSVRGPRVMATATNAKHSTSMFSAPYAVPVPRKPDARIRKGGGVLVGDDIYNITGIGQTRSGAAAPGGAIVFSVSIQNDGPSDRFKVLATGGAVSGYVVSYLRGTTDITAAVVAGTYTTPTLPHGGTFLITAKVKVRSAAPVGSRATRLVTVTSVGSSTKKDAVQLIGRRS